MAGQNGGRVRPVPRRSAARIARLIHVLAAAALPRFWVTGRLTTCHRHVKRRLTAQPPGSRAAVASDGEIGLWVWELISRSLRRGRVPRRSVFARLRRYHNAFLRVRSQDDRCRPCYCGTPGIGLLVRPGPRAVLRMGRPLIARRFSEKEADHLAAGIWPSRVGIGSRRAATGPCVTKAMNHPLL